MSIMIPHSRFITFKHDSSDGRRYGQHFHDYMELEKITNFEDRKWCDQLYIANDVMAKSMVLTIIDYTC